MSQSIQPTEPEVPPCHYHWLGLVDYQAAWDLQQSLAEQRGQGTIADTLLLLEHPSTYTLGACGDAAHLLVGSEVLVRQGVTLVRVDRGGDITFHGPGQLVGYPLLDLSLRRGSVARYLRDLEQVLVQALAEFGVVAGRLRGHTGVWVKDEKIAAIGVKVNARKITTHGFALNVTTDLHYFTQIIPCGIRDKGVTSLARILGRSIPMPEVIARVVECFGRVLGFDMIKMQEQFAETRGRARLRDNAR